MNATMKYQIEKAVADIGVKVVFGSASTPDNAMIEPTDRSIPPRMITIVMPHAKSIFVEI